MELYQKLISDARANIEKNAFFLTYLFIDI